MHEVELADHLPLGSDNLANNGVAALIFVSRELNVVVVSLAEFRGNNSGMRRYLEVVMSNGRIASTKVPLTRHALGTKSNTGTHPFREEEVVGPTTCAEFAVPIDAGNVFPGSRRDVEDVPAQPLFGGVERTMDGAGEGVLEFLRTRRNAACQSADDVPTPATGLLYQTCKGVLDPLNQIGQSADQFAGEVRERLDNSLDEVGDDGVPYEVVIELLEWMEDCSDGVVDDRANRIRQSRQKSS
jgi:hypothetical protein